MNSYSRAKYNKKLIGIGGWKCYCCSPPRSYRKCYKRLIKRQEMKAELQLEMEQAYALMEDENA